MYFNRSTYICLFLTGFLLSACKSDKSFDLDPIDPGTGIFEARGTLTPMEGGFTSLDYTYISGEIDPWGQSIVASTYADFVNYSPYKTIVGRLTNPSVDIFSIGIQSQDPFDTSSTKWDWEQSELANLLQPGDTLTIGYGPGQAILGVSHPSFDHPTGPFYTLPSENYEGINNGGAGFVIIDEVEPYSASAYEITRNGLRIHVHYQGRLNGVLGQPDYWAVGTAVLFFEY